MSNATIHSYLGFHRRSDRGLFCSIGHGPDLLVKPIEAGDFETVEVRIVRVKLPFL